MSQQALLLEAIGQDLVLRQRPIPEPQANQVQIRVSIFGINPHESKSKSIGLFVKDTLPTPIGADILGTVTKLGPGVTKFKVGDTVFGFGDPQQADELGGQEYCLLTCTLAALVPKNVTHDQALTFPLNALTSFLAFFGPQGFALPAPFPANTPSSDLASQSIVIIGGGTATGKFAIEFARIVGFGNIIVTASKSSESLLKSLGATHVIDRRLSDDETEHQVRAIVGDDLVYALDTFNRGNGGQTLGAKLLSNTKRGVLVVLVSASSVDESRIGEKKAGYERRFIICAPKLFPDVAVPYWEALPRWIEEEKLHPTTYSVIEGLDAKKINQALDDYNAGKNVVKPHVHM